MGMPKYARIIACSGKSEWGAYEKYRDSLFIIIIMFELTYFLLDSQLNQAIDILVGTDLGWLSGTGFDQCFEPSYKARFQSSLLAGNWDSFWRHQGIIIIIIIEGHSLYKHHATLKMQIVDSNKHMDGWWIHSNYKLKLEVQPSLGSTRGFWIWNWKNLLRA